MRDGNGFCATPNRVARAIMPEIARKPGTPTTPDDVKKDRSGSDPFMTLEIACKPGTPTTPDDAKKDRSGSDPFMTPEATD